VRARLIPRFGVFNSTQRPIFTQPSLSDSTMTGLPRRSGWNTRSHDTLTDGLGLVSTSSEVS
jgi:hypothetical protein